MNQGFDTLRNWHTETRFTADVAQPGSRWERNGNGVDEFTARAQYEILRLRPGVDVRLVRLDWDDDWDEDASPLETVVAESSGAA